MGGGAEEEGDEVDEADEEDEVEGGEDGEADGAEVESLFSEMDANGDASLSVDEILSKVREGAEGADADDAAELSKLEEQIKANFAKADVDANSLLNQEEASAFLSLFSEESPEEV